MKIYIIIGDYGLNGNHVEDVSLVQRDLSKFVKDINDQLTASKMMHPYMTGWTQWEIDVTTQPDIPPIWTQVDEVGP